MNVKNKHEIYKCFICGNVIEVLTVGGGEIVCCDKPMELMEEKNEDAPTQKVGMPTENVGKGTEKHLPVIEELPASVCQGKDGVKIKVGDVVHPMEEEHYIEWIEIITEDNKRGKRFLKSGDKPEVEFYTRKEVIGARAYCNVHGLWKTNNE